VEDHFDRLDKNQSWPAYLIILVAGALLALSFAPINFIPFAIISPAVLFWFWRDGNAKQAAKHGFVFGLGLFGAGVSWVYVAIHDIGGTAAPLAILLTLLAVAVLALFPALTGWIAVKLRGPEARPAWFILLLPAIWVLLEWIRGWFLTGFTWLQLGYSQTDTTLVYLAPVFGVYGISLAVALSSGLLILIVTQRRHVRLASITGLLCIWLAAALLSTVEWSMTSGEPLQVSLVQGNAPQSTKWDADQIRHRLELYADNTRQHWDSDLIIWPENSLTTFYHTLEKSYLTPLENEAILNNTDLVIGVPVLDLESGAYYSTLASLGKTPGIYRKRHLVPFGEFIPFESYLRGIINFLDLPMSGFTPGPRYQDRLIAAGQVIAPTVCYEDAFGEEVIKHLPEATLIINGSNNAWYGDSFAQHQHLQISRMRAAETSRPLLRVTTNGITAFVDHWGQVISQAPQFKTYVLTGKVQPRKGSTLYVRVGNYLVLALLTVMLVLFLVIRFFQQRNPVKI
jgi:apolipoprotein N-acyltransferase